VESLETKCDENLGCFAINIEGEKNIRKGLNCVGFF
jgi:hypothetical protein